jgi:hypothetical protein
MAENKEVAFFPTEVLKKVKEVKPIMAYIPEDGRDPNPMWDEVARSLWPATKEKQKDREALAEVLMWAAYDDTVLGAAPCAGIVMSRMAQRLMGNEWMERWQWDNYHPLRRKISFNKREFGGLRKVFKNMFS